MVVLKKSDEAIDYITNDIEKIITAHSSMKEEFEIMYDDYIKRGETIDDLKTEINSIKKKSKKDLNNFLIRGLAAKTRQKAKIAKQADIITKLTKTLVAVETAALSAVAATSATATANCISWGADYAYAKAEFSISTDDIINSIRLEFEEMLGMPVTEAKNIISSMRDKLHWLETVGDVAPIATHTKTSAQALSVTHWAPDDVGCDGFMNDGADDGGDDAGGDGEDDAGGYDEGYVRGTDDVVNNALTTTVMIAAKHNIINFEDIEYDGTEAYTDADYNSTFMLRCMTVAGVKNPPDVYEILANVRKLREAQEKEIENTEGLDKARNVVNAKQSQGRHFSKRVVELQSTLVTPNSKVPIEKSMKNKRNQPGRRERMRKKACIGGGISAPLQTLDFGEGPSSSLALAGD
jgi:hypothetical protein